jgi:hypothetical protein
MMASTKQNQKQISQPFSLILKSLPGTLNESSNHTLGTTCTNASFEEEGNAYEPLHASNGTHNHYKMAPTRSILKSSFHRNRESSVHSSVSVLTADLKKISMRSIDSEMTESTDSSFRRKSVGFGSIAIHEHGLVLGDHPDCSYGPPVQLGWECSESKVHHIDDYELSVRRPRRHKSNLAINYYQRKHILSEHMSEKEIKQATRKVEKAKLNRTITRSFLPFHHVEQVVESTSRKVKRVVSKEERRKKSEEKRALEDALNI